MSTAPSVLSPLDRLWRDRPYLPRAIAALVAFIDADDQATRAIEDGLREPAAALLAESYAARDAFSAEYWVPWEVASRVFRRAMLHAASHPDEVAGEAVLHAPTERLFARLGYCDGLANQQAAPASRPGRDPAGDAIARSLEPATPAMLGVIRRMDTRYRRSYADGLEYGQAERILRIESPMLLARIDAQAELVRGMGESFATTASPLDTFVGELPATMTDGLTRAAAGGDMRRLAAARCYAMGRARAVREHVARVRVMRTMQQEMPLRMLTVAATLRVLSRARQEALDLRATLLASGAGGASTEMPAGWAWTAVPAEATPEEVDVLGAVTAFEDQIAEATLLASTVGMPPATYAACLTASATGPVRDILVRTTADQSFARAARQCVRALTAPVAGGAWWGAPHGGVGHLEQDDQDSAIVVRVGEDAVARLLPAVLHPGGRATEAAELLRDLEAGSDAIAPPSECATGPLASLSAAAVVASRRLTGPPSRSLVFAPGVVTLAGYARREASLMSLGFRPGWAGALGAALTHAVAVREAEVLLSAIDSEGWQRVRAEADIVARGRELDLDAAERWVGAYREEAARAGATVDALFAAGPLTPESPLGEAVLLYARARVLEEALVERATAEAYALFARHYTSGGLTQYESPSARKLIEQSVRQAIRRADRDAVSLSAGCPTFGARLRVELSRTALQWWGDEMVAVHTLRADRARVAAAQAGSDRAAATTVADPSATR